MVARRRKLQQSSHEPRGSDTIYEVVLVATYVRRNKPGKTGPRNAVSVDTIERAAYSQAFSHISCVPTRLELLSFPRGRLKRSSAHLSAHNWNRKRSVKRGGTFCELTPKEKNGDEASIGTSSEFQFQFKEI